MKYEEYLCLIERRLKKNFNFNVLDNIEERGIKIDLYANSIFLSCNFLKNKIALFTKFEIYEKYYLKYYDGITNKEIQEYFNFLHIISDDSNPTFQHLHKCVIGVMISYSIDENCESFIESLNHTKPFSMYFKGWSETQLICVNLNTNKIYYNKAAQKSSELFLF